MHSDSYITGALDMPEQFQASLSDHISQAPTWKREPYTPGLCNPETVTQSQPGGYGTVSGEWDIASLVLPIPVLKIRNIYRSHIQVTLELYSYLICLQVLYSQQNYNSNEVLSYSVDFKAPQELWNPLSKAVPGKFHWQTR